ncbi:hypothetical protein ABID94_001124 [Streptomyces sp. PvR018]
MPGTYDADEREPVLRTSVCGPASAAEEPAGAAVVT